MVALHPCALGKSSHSIERVNTLPYSDTRDLCKGSRFQLLQNKTVAYII